MIRVDACRSVVVLLCSVGLFSSLRSLRLLWHAVASCEGGRERPSPLSCHFVCFVGCLFFFSLFCPLDVRGAGADESWCGNVPERVVGVQTDEQLAEAVRSLEPGTLLTLAPGDYTGFEIRVKATAEQPVVIRGAADGTTVMVSPHKRGVGINVEDSSYVVVENITSNGMPRAGLRAAASHHIVFRNCRAADNGLWGIFTGHVDHLLIEGNECSGSRKEHGIYVSNSGDHVTVRGNKCHHNAGCGIQFNADVSCGGDGVISDALIEDNECWENGKRGGAALNLDGVCDSIIRNNRCWNNHASGLTLFKGNAASGSCRNVVTRNVILQPKDGRWCVNINTGSTGNRLIGNVFENKHWFRGAITIDRSSREGYVARSNRVIPTE